MSQLMHVGSAHGHQHSTVSGYGEVMNSCMQHLIILQHDGSHHKERPLVVQAGHLVLIGAHVAPRIRLA